MALWRNIQADKIKRGRNGRTEGKQTTFSYALLSSCPQPEKTEGCLVPFSSFLFCFTGIQGSYNLPPVLRTCQANWKTVALQPLPEQPLTCLSIRQTLASWKRKKRSDLPPQQWTSLKMKTKTVDLFLLALEMGTQKVKIAFNTFTSFFLLLPESAYTPPFKY